MNIALSLAEVAAALAALLVIARRAVPSAARAGLAALVYLGTWIVSYVLAAQHASPLTALASGTAIAASVVAVVMVVHQITADGPGGGDERGWDGPEGPPPGGPPSDPPSTSPEPVWWPEFERQLEAYAARRDRAHRERERAPAG